MLPSTPRAAKIFDYFAVYGLSEIASDSRELGSFPLKIRKVPEGMSTVAQIQLRLSDQILGESEFQERFEIGTFEESTLYLEVQYQQALTCDSSSMFKNSISKIQFFEAELEDNCIKIPSDYDLIPIPIHGKYSHQQDGYHYYTGKYDTRPFIFQNSDSNLHLVLAFSYYSNQLPFLPLSQIFIQNPLKLNLNEEESSKEIGRIPIFLGKNKDSFIYFKRIEPLEFKFEAEILDRYPATDYENSPLNPGIPLFCYDEPLQLSTQEDLPNVFSFIMTTSEVSPENVVRIYVSCLVFYDRLNFKTMKKLGFNGSVFAPKCICLVSHWPFIQQSEAILSFILDYSKNVNDVPIERVICNLIDEVYVKDEKVTIYELASVEFFKAPKYGLPYISDRSILKLFSNISIPNIIHIWNALLLERSVLIVSDCKSDLIYIIMAFTSLLFPLNWELTLITILPEALKDFTGALVPFIAGISRSIFESDLDLPENCVILDIEEGKIYNEDNIVKIPKSIYKNLLGRLKGMFCYDENLSMNTSVLLIQDAFLEAQTCLLKDYQVFLKVDNERLNFNTKKFLSEKERKSDSRFYKEFTETQMFLQFLDKLSSEEIRFFNEALRFERSRKAQCFLRHNPIPAEERSLGPNTEGISPGSTYFYRRFSSLKSDLFIEPRMSSLIQSPVKIRTSSEVPQMSESVWTFFLIKSAFELWMNTFTQFIPKFPEHVNELLCVALIKMEDMKAHLVMPSEEMYLKLIEVCGIFNLKETAKLIRQRMQKDQIKPNAFAYEIYFKAFISKGSINRDEESTNDLVLNRCVFETNFECPTCSRGNELEDIVKNWSQSYSDIDSTCRFCGEDIVPIFSVATSLKNKEFIPLFAPHFLKREIETQIEMYGKEFLLSRSFCENFKSLFWNLVLYFQIFGLPFLWISPNFNTKNMNLILEQYKKKLKIEINSDPQAINHIPISNMRTKDKSLVSLFKNIKAGGKNSNRERSLKSEYTLKAKIFPLIYKFNEFNRKKNDLHLLNRTIFNRTFHDES